RLMWAQAARASSAPPASTAATTIAAARPRRAARSCAHCCQARQSADAARRAREPSSLAGEDDQLPPLRLVVVAQDVLSAIVAADLEVAVVGSQPAIDDFGHFDAPFAQGEAAGCLLAAVSGVALDPQVHIRDASATRGHFLPAPVQPVELRLETRCRRAPPESGAARLALRTWTAAVLRSLSRARRVYF